MLLLTQLLYLSQGENTFSSLIVHVVTQDKAVTVTNVMVDAADADGAGAGDTGSDTVSDTVQVIRLPTRYR